MARCIECDKKYLWTNKKDHPFWIELPSEGKTLRGKKIYSIRHFDQLDCMILFMQKIYGYKKFVKGDVNKYKGVIVGIRKSLTKQKIDVDLLLFNLQRDGKSLDNLYKIL